jgi:glucose dehydrogenase
MPNEIGYAGPQPKEKTDMLAARLCAGVVALCLILASPAAAQVTTADIVGRVTDTSGAVLPGVTVTIENVSTHETRVVPTAGVLVGAAVATALPAAPADDHRDWPSYGGGPEQTHNSRPTDINRSNVRRLEVVWTFDSRETGGLQTNPVVVDGVLYVTIPRHKVVALDAASGTLRWTFDSGIERRGPNRGVTYWAVVS